MDMEIMTQREFDFEIRRIELEMLINVFIKLEHLKREINNYETTI